MQLRYLRRKFIDSFMAFLCALCCLSTVSVLLLLLGYVVYRGASAINLDFFTQLPTPVGEPGGGVANAIVGTLILAGIASVIGIPVGVATGLYLAEYGRG